MEPAEGVIDSEEWKNNEPCDITGSVASSFEPAEGLMDTDGPCVEDSRDIKDDFASLLEPEGLMDSDGPCVEDGREIKDDVASLMEPTPGQSRRKCTEDVDCIVTRVE